MRDSKMPEQEREVFFYYLAREFYHCHNCREQTTFEDSEVVATTAELMEADEEAADQNSYEATYTHVWLSSAGLGIAVVYCDNCTASQVFYSGDDFFEDLMHGFSFESVKEFIEGSRSQVLEYYDLVFGVPRIGDDLIPNKLESAFNNSLNHPPTNAHFDMIQNFCERQFDVQLEKARMKKTYWPE